ncbi:MAG TPA: hypothetical protein PLS67_14425 [Accumulibacter sp.]|jgi:hypothetical protein|nr:hypothetical protein [Accumulibacter sp.]HQC81684.1 hypothetical protein [Accumulibacter sp.]
MVPKFSVGELPPSVAYDAAGRCLSPNCPDYAQLRRFLERYERNYGQRFASDKGVAVAPVSRRDVPPTPAVDIQPGYRQASQIRSEFLQSGKVRDRYTRTGE